MDSPFHPGETAVQERAGVRAQVESIGPRLIRDHMPDQHRELFGKLPTLLVGSLDAQDQPWASMLVGRPGFVSSPDARRLRIAARPDPHDPLADQLAVGVPIGLLGLEPATRRRNRMNGRVVALDAAGFDVAVEQSFGNCPQYIQTREPTWVVDAAAPSAAEHFGHALPAAAVALVQRADTLFIASAGPHPRRGGAQGVDVSHRGGRPGFVRVQRLAQGGHRLTLPDFRGNNLFNTLGNLAAHPTAGLLFYDPERGDRLQVAGRAELVWDGPELAAFAGAQRLLHVTVERGVWAPGALPLRWSPPGYASQLAATGRWDGVSAQSDTAAGDPPMGSTPAAT
ncbi:MAG: pyridoxamine 5'-phosphate oxidase family protein [Piscinibacter sp.]|nr:pyridoxamine 5'-phosphate oxidase family protein [Piscinibacter sp.]